MLSTLTIGVPLVLIILITLSGAVLAAEPLIGALLLAVFVLARKSPVTEIGVGHIQDFHGARFAVEPTGLAAFRFEFPLAELYYLDVTVDKKGRVTAVKPWND